MEKTNSSACPMTPNHKRGRSAVLKSIISPSKSAASPAKKAEPQLSPTRRTVEVSSPMLRERPINQDVVLTSPKKSFPFNVQTRSPAKRHDKSPTKIPGSRLPSPEKQAANRGQENEPPKAAAETPEAPIWAQFTSQNVELDESWNSRSTHDGTNQHEAISRSAAGSDQLNSREEFQIYEDGTGTIVRSPGNPNQSKVQAAVAMFNSKDQASKPTVKHDPKVDADFEAVLVARNIPETMRQNMRQLDTKVKEEFIKNQKTESTSPKEEETSKTSFWSKARPRSGTFGRGRSKPRTETEPEEPAASPSKRARSRSRTFNWGSKGERSSSKRQRSNSRPRSLMSLKNLSASSVNSVGYDGSKDVKEQATPTSPEDFICYLREAQRPQEVEVGKLHKLRTLLRHESVAWVEVFLDQNGLEILRQQLKNVMDLEWREEHEDLLLNELLLCIKALSTTEKALKQFRQVGPALFPSLLRMLFDEERKGPSEYSTRSIIINTLFNYLAAAIPEDPVSRAEEILRYLSDGNKPPGENEPLDFIQQMKQTRPYQSWCGEVSNVTREVFWIFLHHLNVIALPEEDHALSNSLASPRPGTFLDTSSTRSREAPYTPPASQTASANYRSRHFPGARPPQPAAPYVGGVEWDATHYLAAHLDLMNGLLACLPTRAARNALRRDLAMSGFERVMAERMRTCKEKFYGCVHDGLRTWVAAAVDDAWNVSFVRCGPSAVEHAHASPTKEHKDAPRIDVPLLAASGGHSREGQKDDFWI